MVNEDPLARIHRKWRERCIRDGVYRGINPADIAREEARWKAECNRPPRPGRKRKYPPKGHAD
jgi:hypothetical protein